MVTSVIEYFSKEKGNNGPLIDVKIVKELEISKSQSTQFLTLRISQISSVLKQTPKT